MTIGTHTIPKGQKPKTGALSATVGGLTLVMDPRLPLRERIEKIVRITGQRGRVESVVSDSAEHTAVVTFERDIAPPPAVVLDAIAQACCAHRAEIVDGRRLLLFFQGA